ncbi:hypothetical protein ACWIGM_05070 [Bosea sp. NPDC055332]
MKFRSMLLVSAGLVLLAGSGALAQIAPAPTISCGGITITDCVKRVHTAMSDPKATPQQVLQAWGAWSEVYERAYRSLKDAPVRPSDIDRIEGKLKDKIDSYTNPETVLVDQAIKRFFPTLAAIFAFAEGPVGEALFILFSPTPTVTPIQQLKLHNDDLAKVLLVRMTPLLNPDWKWRYNTAISEVLQGTPIGGKP